MIASHELVVDPLSRVRLGEMMSKDAVFISPHLPVEQVITRINAHDPELTWHQLLLLVDKQKRLKGIITRGDLRPL